MDALSLNFTPRYHDFPARYHGFGHENKPPKNLKHTHRYWNVDFVLFHSVTCYTNSHLSHTHANIAQLLNVTRTLVATKHDITEFRVLRI